MSRQTAVSAESQSDPLSAHCMGAIAVLSKIHGQVLDWFEDYSSAGSNLRKQELASRICRGLQVHMALEQDIFLPALLKTVNDPAAYEVAASDHFMLGQLTEQVRKSSPIDEMFDSKVRILHEAFAQRVADEAADVFAAIEGSEMGR
jgi:hypothetical protein